jgi:CRP/FNR family transcriptional regulator
MAHQKLSDVLSVSLPFWGSLSEIEKEKLSQSVVLKKYRPGTIIHNSTDENCPGLQIVKSGRVRVFISSREGKQLTLQRILHDEIFVIGFSCVLDDIIFDVNIETETDCEILLLPREICKRLYETNAVVRRAATYMVGAKFANTMRLLEAVAFTSMGSRLANALIEQSALAESTVLNVTHASIAADLGTAREVITRLLKQFQLAGIVSRLGNKIKIEDMQALLDMRGEHLYNMNELIYPK